MAGAELGEPHHLSIAARCVIFAIRAYQSLISPLLGKNCRFHPTCSQYAIEAIRSFGCLRGIAMGAARIARCGPWHPGGYDPVPKPGKRNADRDDRRTFVQGR